jgi:hypothetical protein
MTMSNEKLKGLEKKIADNREKALAIIGKHNPNGEKVLFFTSAKTSPAEILTWIPLIGPIIELSKKNYLLAVTPKRFLVIRIKKMVVEELDYQEIPIEAIRESVLEKILLLWKISLTLADGKKMVFKDMIFEWATDLKKAIDTAQGRPSTAS